MRQKCGKSLTLRVEIKFSTSKLTRRVGMNMAGYLWTGAYCQKGLSPQAARTRLARVANDSPFVILNYLTSRITKFQGKNHDNQSPNFI